MMKRALLIASLTLFSFSAVAGGIKEIKTDGGYTVWLAEDHTLPVMTVKISFEKSGAAYDPADKPGLAAFLGQMLDEGAGDMDALTFHKALENKAIRFSVDTGQDLITVSMQTLSENKDEALKLMLLALTRPRIDPEAFERIRASITADLTQLQEEPDYIASRKWKELAFGNHAYAHPRRGTPDSLKTITREDLKLYAETHFFAGARPVISVVGDVTAEEIQDWDLPAFKENAAATNLPDVTVPDAEAPVVVTHNVPQTVVLASLPALKRDDPKFYTLQVLNQILGGNSITSRLGSEVRNKRGLAYHIGSGIEVMDSAYFLSVNFATRNEQAYEALGVFNEVVQDIRDKGVTEKELQDAKNYLMGSFALNHDTQNELAGFLIGVQHFNLGIDYPGKRNTFIDKVTLQDVNDLAKTLFAHKPLVVMVGKPGAAAP